ncbi:MAG: hypothetical protein ACJAWZ_003057 [Paracoccaceae bacterium]|jgi:hypothetical protein
MLRPDHPISTIRAGGECQKLRTIVGSLQADGAFSIRGDHIAPVGGDVHRPDRIRGGAVPKLRALGETRAQGPTRPQHQPRTARMNCEDAGHLIAIQRQQRAAQLRGSVVRPVGDPGAGLLGVLQPVADNMDDAADHPAVIDPRHASRLIGQKRL